MKQIIFLIAVLLCVVTCNSKRVTRSTSIEDKVNSFKDIVNIIRRIRDNVRDNIGGIAQGSPLLKLFFIPLDATIDGVELLSEKAQLLEQPLDNVSEIAISNVAATARYAENLLSMAFCALKESHLQKIEMPVQELEKQLKEVKAQLRKLALQLEKLLNEDEAQDRSGLRTRIRNLKY